jgi:nucleotide sugar dehydrogenase
MVRTLDTFRCLRFPAAEDAAGTESGDLGRIPTRRGAVRATGARRCAQTEGLSMTTRHGAALAHARATDRAAVRKVAIVGLGYVGLPTALSLYQAGAEVVGIDISAARIRGIRRGIVDLTASDHERLSRADADPDRFTLTRSAEAIAAADAVIVCVPTPIDEHHVPDLRALSAATRTVCRHARRGQTIILTSTAYVGSTRQLLVEPLRARGLEPGRDVCVAFSPERIDPANVAYPLELVPRVVGAISERCAERAEAVIGLVAPATTRVSSPEAAEMTKLYENVFRAVNISLANELADACRELALSPREVIDAAATKPFGFMPFRPGPGVGGHCIPCDPHYLVWQLRARQVHMPLVERAMTAIALRPAQVVERAADVMSKEHSRGLAGSRILVVGVSYKPGVSDVRESPALVLVAALRRRGAEVFYYDPLVPVVDTAAGPMISVAGPPDPADYDLVIAHTVHPGHDHGFLADAWPLLDCTYSLEGRRIEL